MTTDQLAEVEPSAWTSKKALKVIKSHGFATVGKDRSDDRSVALYTAEQFSTLLTAEREARQRAEARAYELAVAIMGGEDAPGYADSIDTAVLIAQIKDERLKRDAWTDAAVKVATEAAESSLREAEAVIAPFAKLGANFIHEDYSSTKSDDSTVWGFNDDELTYGNFRAAAKFMEKPDGK